MGDSCCQTGGDHVHLFTTVFFVDFVHEGWQILESQFGIAVVPVFLGLVVLGVRVRVLQTVTSASEVAHPNFVVIIYDLEEVILCAWKVLILNGKKLSRVKTLCVMVED